MSLFPKAVTRADVTVNVDSDFTMMRCKTMEEAVSFLRSYYPNSIIKQCDDFEPEHYPNYDVLKRSKGHNEPDRSWYFIKKNGLGNILITEFRNEAYAFAPCLCV